MNFVKALVAAAFVAVSTGAGSTFIYPVLSADAFKGIRQRVNYQSIGSGAGIVAQILKFNSSVRRTMSIAF